MANANIYLTYNGRVGFLQAVNEEAIAKYSKVARRAIEAQTE